MEKQREELLKEIERLKKAINNSKSEYLKRDYGKALKRKQKELITYDKIKRRYIWQ